MIEKKWTPGPWRVTERDGNDICIVSDCGAIAKAIRGQESPEKPRANALLIAAAPDLYDALYDCVHTLERIRRNSSTLSLRHEHPAVLAGQAALAKATGGTT